MTDENCGICDNQGWCESCKTGFVYETDQCVEIVYTEVGLACNSNSTCIENGVCKDNCCSQWMTDEHCGSCNDQGWCATCENGYIYNTDHCVEVDTSSGCNADNQCSSGNCQEFCCSEFLNDENCANCDSQGWCAECSLGSVFDSGTGKCESFEIRPFPFESFADGYGCYCSFSNPGPPGSDAVDSIDAACKTLMEDYAEKTEDIADCNYLDVESADHIPANLFATTGDFEAECIHLNTVISDHGECAAAICEAEAIFSMRYWMITQGFGRSLTGSVNDDENSIFDHSNFNPDLECIVPETTTEEATTLTAEASTAAPTTEEPTQVGFPCDSNSTCSDGGVCKNNCCSQFMTDENCGICDNQGWCESCKTGFVYETDQCVEIVYTEVGLPCDSNSTCTENGVCKNNCCSQWMTDEHCDSCNDQGWCATCETGYFYEIDHCVEVDSASGCNADNQCSSGNCQEFCCSEFLNDENCAKCDSQGWCAECVFGSAYDSETGKCESFEMRPFPWQLGEYGCYCSFSNPGPPGSEAVDLLDAACKTLMENYSEQTYGIDDCNFRSVGNPTYFPALGTGFLSMFNFDVEATCDHTNTVLTDIGECAAALCTAETLFIQEYTAVTQIYNPQLSTYGHANFDPESNCVVAPATTETAATGL